MDELLNLRDFCREIGCAYIEQEPMSKHTTFKIGGPADLFLRPKDASQALQVLKKAKELNVSMYYIGKGSDLLVDDAGIRGVVLSFVETSGEPCVRADDDTLVDCPAGVSLAALCLFVQKQGLSGLEFAYGIPGSLGGAVFMNAGAYGGEMCDVVEQTSYIDPNSMQELKRNLAQMKFCYRHSWFSNHPEALITGAALRLTKGDPQEIRRKMEHYLECRKQKQPLEYPSAGSTFKRPEGSYASALIDRCGLKGRRVGDAMVSEKHAGFVINCGCATCRDVLELIRQIQQEVLSKTGYRLECEIKCL